MYMIWLNKIKCIKLKLLKHCKITWRHLAMEGTNWYFREKKIIQLKINSTTTKLFGNVD